MTTNDVCFVDALTEAMAKVLSSDVAFVIAVGNILFSRGRRFGGLLCHRRRDAGDTKTKPKYGEVLVQCFLQWVRLS